MAFTQISTSNLDNTINTKLAAGESANASIISLTTSLAPKIASVNVASNTFTVLDDTAVNVGGGYIVVTGANFQSGATVLIDTVQASAVTYVNSTTLQVQVPARSAATYNLYVVNPDGGTGIRVNSLTYSSEPSWVTSSPLSNQVANTAFGVNLSATGASSYSVAAGSTLPAGTTLAANGYFSGTVTIGAQTTYSFDVVATDAELQDSSKTFQVTITVTPQTRLYAWGSGSVTPLNNTVDRSSPVQVGTNTNWSKIASGNYNSFAIKTDGTLWAWGQNSKGELGTNNKTFASSPVQVGTGTNWSLVSAGEYGTIAIKTDGTLWAWGQNTRGQLGLNDIAYRSSPTQVGSNTNWSKADINRYSYGGMAIATKTDGTLWTWGSGDSGQLGINSPNYSRSSPTQVGTNTNWSIVKSAGAFNYAIKTNGTLWAWGSGALGRLGNDQSAQDKSSPTQVGTNTNWSQISLCNNSIIGLKTDGTLWAWGRNAQGEAGLNDSVSRSSPTQVGSNTNWGLVGSLGYNGMAIKTDGTLWTWGRNNYGTLGDNSVVNKSSPVQIGSNINWTSVSVGVYHSMAIATN